tara:strand:+ start:10 stop:1494 length:1485 start_codon:yes stop_codon:yes gene_type:complete
MGGGLMQLVAYGAQDIYLTGNPQITFFKVVYRRHTNFAMEAIEQTFNGTASFGKKATCTISRNGDLIHRMYLQVDTPAVTTTINNNFRWLNWLGHVIVKNVELEIGGQRIDKHYGDWLHIWNELTQSAGHQAGYANMVGNVPALTQYTSGAHTVPATTLFVPLQFWFCRNPGLALPLIALQYHEVKVNVELNDKPKCHHTSEGSGPSVGELTTKLFVDYIYLDTDERRRFAQISHEYLIEQLQFTGDEAVTSTSAKIKLNFNHPVKELVWVVRRDAAVVGNTDSSLRNYGGNQTYNFTDSLDSTFFSGTPSDPLGGGMGSAAALSANFPYSLPMNSNAVANGTGISQGIGDFKANTVTFANLFESNASAAVGLSNLSWRVGLPVMDAGDNPVSKAKLQLNGHDRFAERPGRYFNLVQPYQHHTNVPATGINVYSFGLKPEEHQPSGTCNFSRIDNATLHLTLTKPTGNAKVSVYAVNYNVLRIMSGMGGLAYSN